VWRLLCWAPSEEEKRLLLTFAPTFASVCLSVCVFVCLDSALGHLVCLPATWFAARASRKQEQNGGRASVLRASNAHSHNTAQANNAHSFLAFFCVLKAAQKEPVVALQTVCARPLVQLLRRHSAADHKDHCL